MPTQAEKRQGIRITPETRKLFAENKISSRLVLNFSGFEKMSVHSHLGRLKHCASKTGQVFGFTVDDQPEPEGEYDGVCGFHTTGRDWATETRLVQFGWYDIVLKYESDPYPRGFLRSFPKYLAFFADGTVARYMRTSRLYFLFAMYPLVLSAFLAALSIAAVIVVVNLTNAPIILSALALAIIAPLVWLALCRWPGTKLYLPLSIADWGFARDMINKTNSEIQKRIETFSHRITEEIEASRQDEIVVVGHSFGSVWAVSALSLALQRNPKLLEHRKVRFLALGSSHLKIALCSRAKWFRDDLQRIVGEPNLFWHEFQSKDDVIAFYKADPFKPVGIDGTAGGYKVDRIRFKRGMVASRYRKMKRSLYSTHRQYVRYYDKPVDFDYGIRLFGPFDTRLLAKQPGLVSLLAADKSPRGDSGHGH